MASTLSTQDKALQINLDPTVYGSFAEIGAGQEVARWFFRAGAASKTVAKTMSAYDMTFSDAIYGPEKTGRYVVESRLKKMLDHEYKLLVERLSAKRGDSTKFFAFADTVAATSFKRLDQEGRGWVGVRFQKSIKGEPNEIVMHVRLFDKDPILQQEQIGILGVNLIYGAYFIDSPEEFIASLTDGIKEGSVEVEMLRVSGPELKHVDNRLLAIGLMEHGMTNAVLFDPSGEVVQPSDLLYKKNVIVQRGSFRPFTNLHQDMLIKGRDQFCGEKGCDISKTIVVMEMTTKSLTEKGFLNYRDFLDRVEMLNALGYHVLISDYLEYYKLRQYLTRYSSEDVAILMGAIHLDEIFNPEYYKDLKGGILEAFGQLFSGPAKMYIYPASKKGGGLLTLETFKPKDNVVGLYEMLRRNGHLVDIKGVDDRYLHIQSRELSQKIQSHDSSWENDVPSKVAEVIKTRKLFEA